MQVLDLHIGRVKMGETQPEGVAIMLQEAGMDIRDDKAGHVLYSWIDVLEVVTGLLREAHHAFGPPRKL